MIKKVNEDLKKKQDEYAKEAGESTENITMFKNNLNQANIESKLQI